MLCVGTYFETLCVGVRRVYVPTLERGSEGILCEPSDGNKSVTVHRFRVKDKEGIEDLKSSLQMLLFPSNCQFGFKHRIRSAKDDSRK